MTTSPPDHPEAGTPVLEATGLTVAYDAAPVLQDVSL